MSSETVTRFPFSENGARIRRARNLTALSQERFAPIIGTTRRHIIRLENGEHLPGSSLRDRIVEVTGTREQIRAEDDDEEDSLPLLAILENPSIHTVLWLRATAKKNLRDAQEIEKYLKDSA